VPEFGARTLDLTLFPGHLQPIDGSGQGTGHISAKNRVKTRKVAISGLLDQTGHLGAIYRKTRDLPVLGRFCAVKNAQRGPTGESDFPIPLNGKWQNPAFGG
jgi:hypothetical protein